MGRISNVSLFEKKWFIVGPTAKMAEDSLSFSYDENGNPASVQVSKPRALQTKEVQAVVQGLPRLQLRL